MESFKMSYTTLILYLEINKGVEQIQYSIKLKYSAVNLALLTI